MGKVYCTLIPTAFWLGVAAFVLAVFLVVFTLPFPFRLTPGGIVHGAEALLLIAVAGYCAHGTGPKLNPWLAKAHEMLEGAARVLSGTEEG